MKPALTRRYRRRTPAKTEGIFFKKESQEKFFGGAEHDSFFQPAMAPVQNIQRKCDNCKEDDNKVQRMEDKKEEEQVMRAMDDKDKEKIQRVEDKEEKKVMKSEDRKEEKIQKKEANGSSISGNSVSNYIGSLNGKGNPLPHQSNQFFSSKMGYDFSNVKVHTDKEAAESAKGINAKAYTTGNNVVFNEGQYNMESGEGKKLMAHELAHVVQQGNNISKKSIQRKMGDGHDLTNPRFSGDLILEDCYDNMRMLAVGSTGGAVTKVQQALMDAGFPLPAYGVDGIFGDETKTAVQNFQQSQGLVPDGVIGPLTMGALDTHINNTGKAVPQVQPAVQPLGPIGKARADGADALGRAAERVKAAIAARDGIGIVPHDVDDALKRFFKGTGYESLEDLLTRIEPMIEWIINIPTQRIPTPVPPGTSHAAQHIYNIGKTPAFAVSMPDFLPPHYIALYDDWAVKPDVQASILLHEAYHYSFPTMRTHDPKMPWSNPYAIQGFVSVLGGLKTGSRLDKVFPP